MSANIWGFSDSPGIWNKYTVLLRWKYLVDAYPSFRFLIRHLNTGIPGVKTSAFLLKTLKFPFSIENIQLETEKVPFFQLGASVSGVF